MGEYEIFLPVNLIELVVGVQFGWIFNSRLRPFVVVVSGAVDYDTVLRVTRFEVVGLRQRT